MEYAYIIVMFFLVIMNIYLAGSKKSPLLGFVFAIVSICVVAAAQGMSVDIPFFPLPNVLLGLTAVVTIFSAGLTIRGS